MRAEKLRLEQQPKKKEMQEISFMYFLKLYRKLFEYRTLMITIVQKPTKDTVQLRTMLEDFQRVLNDFDFEQVCGDALLANPDFPAVRIKEGW